MCVCVYNIQAKRCQQVCVSWGQALLVNKPCLPSTSETAEEPSNRTECFRLGGHNSDIIVPSPLTPLESPTPSVSLSLYLPLFLPVPTSILKPPPWLTGSPFIVFQGAQRVGVGFIRPCGRTGSGASPCPVSCLKETPLLLRWRPF